MRRSLVSPQDSQDVDPADAGEVDVHQDHVRLIAARKLDAAIAIHRAQKAQVLTARHQLLDQLEVRRIVLHIKQSAHTGAARCRRLGHCGRFNRSGERKGRSGDELDPENASRPYRALHTDGALHQLHKALTDHETDARPLLGVALLAETVERLEELRQFCRRQTCPGIGDRDANMARARCAAVHDHRPSHLVVLDGVGEKVDQNLFDAGPIGLDRVRHVETGEGHADAPPPCQWLDHRLALEHHLDQRDRLERHGKLPRFDHGQVEDLVDQLQQIPAAVQDLADAFFLGGRWGRRIGLHELGESEDGIERRAKLVAHAGKEIRLGQIGFFCGGLGIDEGRLDLVALGQVPGQLGEAAQSAGMISNGREDRVGPER